MPDPVIYLRPDDPRLHRAIKKLAEMRGQSINQLACDLLAGACGEVPEVAEILRRKPGTPISEPPWA